MDTTQQLDPENLRDLFKVIYDRWMEDRLLEDGRKASRVSKFLRNINYVEELSREPDFASIDLDALESKYTKYYTNLVNFWNQCQVSGLNEDESLMREFRQVGELLWYSYTEAYSSVRCSLAELGADLPEVPPALLSLRFSGLVAYNLGADNKTKLNPFQHLLLFLLDRLYRNNWRRFKGDCYEEIKVNGVGSHAWRSVMSISDFVYSAVPKEQYYEQWQWMTSSTGMPRQLIEYLNHVFDAQFPVLEKRRGVISFNNGVYICREQAFYPYVKPDENFTGQLADDLPRSLVACNFIDNAFSNYAGAGVDWRLMPTPVLQSIFDYQELPDNVCLWIYGLLGRLLYAVNEVDRWQVMLFFKGTAGTGKSTICKMVSEFYEQCDVGVLSNRVETQFGLAPFADCMIFIAPEIKRDCQLDQADLQTLIAGERMSIARKHQDPKIIEWTAPGLLAGNEVPNWTDNAGSISRRMVTVHFSKKVLKTDSNLWEKLKEEIPVIIEKCNTAYLQMYEFYGHGSLWDDALPDYFKQVSREMQASCNALIAFIRSDYVRLDPDLYCPEREFQQYLNNFIKQANYTSSYRWESDFYRAIFDEYNLSIKDSELPWPIDGDDLRRGRYIFGCTTMDLQTRRRMPVN